MNKERTIIILWIIFGFVFIQAVDSILFLFIHLVYFTTVFIGISYSILNFVLPAITVSSYLVTIMLLLKKTKISSPTNGILLTKFPKRLFISLLILAIILNPATNKLSGLFAEFASDLDMENPTEFIEFRGWMHMGIGLARWSSVIIIGLVYLNKYNLKE